MHGLVLADRERIKSGFIEGLLLPVRGAKMLARDPELRRLALTPAAWLAILCATLAVLTAGFGGAMVHRFYVVFAALAPLPTLIFGQHYARLAAETRRRLGEEVSPVDDSIARSLGRVLMQVILAGIGLLPLTLALKFVPLAGKPLAKAVLALWALHWIVVNALESGRALKPGQTVEDLDRVDESARAPWFIRLMRQIPLLGWFAAVCDGLASPWRSEIDHMERSPAMAVGFALTTAVLLCTPVLNLFFRPVVIAAAAIRLNSTQR
jgi:uncharacterized protein involved in cysteine biosynthesis